MFCFAAAAAEFSKALVATTLQETQNSLCRFSGGPSAHPFMVEVSYSENKAISTLAGQAYAQSPEFRPALTSGSTMIFQLTRLSPVVLGEGLVLFSAAQSVYSHSIPAPSTAVRSPN